MTIPATGDHARAEGVIAGTALVRPPVQKILDRLHAVTVDIEPWFTAADVLALRQAFCYRPDQQARVQAERGLRCSRPI